MMNKGGLTIVSKSKKKFLVIIILISAILISTALYLAIGMGVSTRSVGIESMMKDNKTLQITGSTSNSGLAFTGYGYTIKGDTLYLKLRYSLVSPFHNAGEFSITLNNDLANVKYIYLQGSETKDKKLIWTK